MNSLMASAHVPGIAASTSIVLLLFFLLMSLYSLCQLAIAEIDLF